MPPNLNAAVADCGGDLVPPASLDKQIFRCAILGCGMMGQEHASYISGYPTDLRVDFLCDPHQPSLDKCCRVLRDFSAAANNGHHPTLLHSEHDLLQRADEIDLLVIATPNYLHTDTLLRWSHYDITILVEKPVAVNRHQHALLTQHPNFKARLWVAMEYRFIPAIAKLIELIPEVVGDIKMCTVRENRYPFLKKFGGWNRDPKKTGDTLVEKWCVP